MALTTQILNAAGSGTVLSTDAGQYGTQSPHMNFINGILYPQRVRDKSGVFQVGANTGLTGSVTLQGRMSSTDSWYDIITVTQADWNADPQFSVVKIVTLFPEMRCKSVMSAGTPVVSAWISE